MLASILHDDPKWPDSIRGDLPPELTRLIQRCLRKDPAFRFQHMADLKPARAPVGERRMQRDSLVPNGMASTIVVPLGMNDVRTNWLNDRRRVVRDTVEFLRTSRKPELERCTCKAFLRCAGIRFRSSQVQSSGLEPPDVLFKSARFEVTVIHEPGRRIHGEYKDRLAHLENVQDLSETVEPYRPKRTLESAQLIDLLSQAMTKKAEHYKNVRKRPQGCTGLDLLIYINRNVSLGGKLDRVFDLPVKQGWRSVSVLVPPHSYVLYASTAAPHFLRKRVGKPKAEWRKRFQTGMFDE